MFKLVGHLRRAAPHTAGARLSGEIFGIRNHPHKTSRIDNARRPYRHAFGADEIQIAADAVVLDGVYRALYVNFALDQVYQVVGLICRLALQMEMHIGDIALGNFKLLETVIAKINPVILQYLLGIDIVYFSVGGQGLVIRIFNGGRPTAYRRQQYACRHKRQRPAAGRGQQTACRRTPLRFRRTRRQEADDTPCIILPVVLYDFRNNYITVPYMAPDNLIRLIHGVPPSLPPAKGQPVCYVRCTSLFFINPSFLHGLPHTAAGRSYALCFIVK